MWDPSFELYRNLDVGVLEGFVVNSANVWILGAGETGEFTLYRIGVGLEAQGIFKEWVRKSKHTLSDTLTLSNMVSVIG